jgi:glycosyltransferase involved in cell wall biosynthesis
MPNVVLEAMASGVPVVMTPFIGLSEDFGRPGEEYLLAKRNPEALASTMSEVLNDEKFQARLGKRGRDWVERTMDLEKSLDRYAAFYRDLAQKGQRGVT